jgi:hypothetical protein
MPPWKDFGPDRFSRRPPGVQAPGDWYGPASGTQGSYPQGGGFCGRVRLAGQPGHPFPGEDRVHPRQAVPMDGSLCLKAIEAELPPEALGAGAFCGLPCVTPVSLEAQIRGKKEV